MTGTPRSAPLFLVMLGMFALSGCPARKPEKAPDKKAKGPELSVADEDVHPVYELTPGKAVPPDPLAQRLCAALMVLPEQRRAQCCSSPPGVGAELSGECVRMLSASLRAHAVKLEPATVDACEKAMARVHAGCEWVGPWPPAPPAECRGIIQGTLADKTGCRSSLECAGHLRCQGLTPTAAGVCGPALPDGAICGGSGDPLAAYARQDDLDADHPECAGYCNRSRCAPVQPLGSACVYSGPCGPGRHCADNKCVEGRFARTGEKCTSGGCEPGTLCFGGTCIVPRPEGEVCEEDMQCRGACMRPDGGHGGTCRHDCGRR